MEYSCFIQRCAHETLISGFRPARILCIDDAEIALRVRKLLLTIAGYEVVTAASGEEGLELFKRDGVDLVIADHFLTDKTGTEIASEMKTIKPPYLSLSSRRPRTPRMESNLPMGSTEGESPEVLLETIARLLAMTSRVGHRSQQHRPHLLRFPRVVWSWWTSAWSSKDSR